jgi:hypothetical protein
MSTLTLTEQAAPSTPSAGKAVIYLKADGFFYSKDDAGVETLINDAVLTSAVVTALALKLNATEKGAANGVATLGADSKIPAAQLPLLTITNTFPVATEVAQLALTAEVGDIAVRTDLNKSYILAADPASVLGNWQELLTPTDTVTSVAGKAGVVTLDKTDVGLGNVDNTSDATKDAAVATLANKTLTTPLIGQYTTAGAPAYAMGALYYDTTLNKLRVGGATTWETVTSS